MFERGIMWSIGGGFHIVKAVPTRSKSKLSDLTPWEIRHVLDPTGDDKHHAESFLQCLHRLGSQWMCPSCKPRLWGILIFESIICSATSDTFRAFCMVLCFIRFIRRFCQGVCTFKRQHWKLDNFEFLIHSVNLKSTVLQQGYTIKRYAF